jgi:uncharacterized protein
MPTVDHHAPGTFSWIELVTTDQPAAKSFYTSLFGWTVHDMPMGPDDFYSIFRVQGLDAAAAYTLRPDQREVGVPTHWTLYVAVENADATTKRAEELGGRVLGAPFDVFDIGRMAVLQDPTGASFCIWQPKKKDGTGITGVHGTLCWADLNTPDRERATSFYSGLFGWKFETGEGKDSSDYLHIKQGDEFIGGVPPAAHRNPNAPPHWLAYFLVDSCDDVASRGKSLGAQQYLPPTSMEGVGRFAIMADPQGAVFAIFEQPREGGKASG